MKLFGPYYQTEGGGGIGDVNIDDDAVDDKDDDKELEDDKDNEEEDDKDKDDEDKDDKEDKEEDKELARADYKALKTEFPDLFKKHPEFKEAIFREQAFTEIFPTVELAQQAADAQITLEEITSSVLSGNASHFIEQLKTEDARGMEKFSRNFLPALQKSDKNLFLEIVSPVASQMIKNVYEAGKKETDEKTKNNIMSAAKIVRRMLFGGDYDDIDKDFVGLVDADKDKKNEEDDKVVRERLVQQYQKIQVEVRDACYGLLQNEIDKGLADLKEKPGLKKMLAKQIKDEVISEMDRDSNYLKRMTNLWDREQRNGFSGMLKSSFTTTFMGKAKTLIPKLRTQMRKEVLGKESKSDESLDRLDVGIKGSGKDSSKIKEAAKSGSSRAVFDA